MSPISEDRPESAGVAIAPGQPISSPDDAITSAPFPSFTAAFCGVKVAAPDWTLGVSISVAASRAAGWFGAFHLPAAGGVERGHGSQQ